MLWIPLTGMTRTKNPKPSRVRSRKFQKAALAADSESHPAVGLGTDFRLESRKTIGFSLALDDQLIHVSIFSRVGGQHRNVADSRIERFSRRRRNRRT